MADASGPDTSGPDAPGTDAQRLDKWLCYVRFARTRTAAQQMVSRRKVRVNRVKVTQPARLVRVGDILTIAGRRDVAVVRVTGFVDRRVGPPVAATLFERVAQT